MKSVSGREGIALLDQSTATKDKMLFHRRLLHDLKINKWVYLMLLPVVLYYFVFQYVPMYGIQIAFKDYTPMSGITNSPWVGFKHFTDFFHSYYFWRLIRNTLLLGLYDLLFGFPAPILLALLLNELHSKIFKRVVQTITYLPYFISLVVVAGILFDFLARDGLINNILAAFGIGRHAYLQESQWFRTIFVGSNIWQFVGWGSIIYLAAIANIDPTLYEAAKVDGANRWKQTIHITIPSIMSTIIILFILQMGSIMSVSSDKIILLYNTITYDTADVINTYVYRKGLIESNFSSSGAIGLFSSLINFALLVIVNYVSRRMSETKLW